MSELPLSEIVEIAVTNVIGDRLDRIITSLNRINGQKTYSIKEVAKLLDKNYYTIRKHIEQGILSASKNGKNYTITQQNLEEYLQTKEYMS